MDALATKPRTGHAGARFMTPDGKNYEHRFENRNLQQKENVAPKTNRTAIPHDPHINDEEMHGIEFHPQNKCRRNWGGLFKGTRDF